MRPSFIKILNNPYFSNTEKQVVWKQRNRYLLQNFLQYKSLSCSLIAANLVLWISLHTSLMLSIISWTALRSISCACLNFHLTMWKLMIEQPCIHWTQININHTTKKKIKKKREVKYLGQIFRSVKQFYK